MKFPWQTNDEQQIENSIRDLRAETAQWEGKLAKLTQAHQGARNSEVAVRRERQQYLVNALADDDQAAQDQLDRLQAASDRAGRNVTDLALAMRDAERKLGGLRKELASTERDLVITRARTAIARRREMTSEIQTVFSSLLSELEEADKLADSVDAELKKLGIRSGPSTVRERLREFYVKLIRIELNRRFPQAWLEFRTELVKATFEEIDSDCFDIVRAELDRAAKKEPPVAEAEPPAGEEQEVKAS
jgi:hypothetical protein